MKETLSYKENLDIARRITGGFNEAVFGSNTNLTALLSEVYNQPIRLAFVPALHIDYDAPRHCPEAYAITESVVIAMERAGVAEKDVHNFLKQAEEKVETTAHLLQLAAAYCDLHDIQHNLWDITPMGCNLEDD